MSPILHVGHLAARGCAALFAVLTLTASGCVGLGTVGTYREVEVPVPVEIAETAAQLRSRRGPPDDVAHLSDSAEEWTYSDDLRWGGVVPFVVIPIPLMLPIGRRHAVFTIEDGVVIRTEHVGQRWSGWACGMVGHRFGCETWDTHE